MSHLNAFAISAAGIEQARMRAEVAALNIANMHSTGNSAAAAYRPRQVLTHSTRAISGFEQGLALPDLAPKATIVQLDTAPRMVHEPGHPDADAKGWVAYPSINLVSEMVAAIAASRSHEANLAALAAARAMALKALEIGGR